LRCFRIIWGHVLIQGKVTKFTRGKIGVYGGMDEVRAVREMYKMSVAIHVVSESQITEPHYLL
jgi:hypothetical protein